MSAFDEMSAIKRMEWANQAIQSLYPSDPSKNPFVDPRAELREHAEILLKDLRDRIARCGWPQTIAFFMAKAAFHEPNPNSRKRAYRWVLHTLLSSEGIEDWKDYYKHVSGTHAITPRMDDNLIESITWLSRFAVSSHLVTSIVIAKSELDHGKKL